MTVESMTGMINWIIKGSRHETRSLPDNLTYSTTKVGAPVGQVQKKRSKKNADLIMQGQDSELKRGSRPTQNMRGYNMALIQVLREASPEGRLYRQRMTREEHQKVSTVIIWRDRSYGSWIVTYGRVKCNETQDSYMPVKRPLPDRLVRWYRKKRINIQILQHVTCTILSSRTSKLKASRNMTIQMKQLVEEMTKTG